MRIDKFLANIKQNGQSVPPELLLEIHRIYCLSTMLPVRSKKKTVIIFF